MMISQAQYGRTQLARVRETMELLGARPPRAPIEKAPHVAALEGKITATPLTAAQREVLAAGTEEVGRTDRGTEREKGWAALRKSLEHEVEPQREQSPKQGDKRWAS